jgi:membrane-bound metal-dependent hydrolase YbcI (DUF457 family)
MLGRTHALSGAVVGAAVGLTATHLTPGPLAVGVVLTAGAAVLPDIDHPDATCARSFGFITQAFAWVIEHVSGGHRHGTHSLVGIAAFSAAAFAADTYRQVTAGKIALGLLLLWPLSRQHVRLLPEPLAFTTGTRPERWFVAPLLFVALAGLGVIAAEGVYLAVGGPLTLG